MIYLFHGSDTHKVRSKAFAWITAVRAKETEASYVRLSAEAIDEYSLQEIVQSQGLFFSKMLVLLDDPFSLTASGDAVLEALPQLATSQNKFPRASRETIRKDFGSLVNSGRINLGKTGRSTN